MTFWDFKDHLCKLTAPLSRGERSYCTKFIYLNLYTRLYTKFIY